MKEKKHIFRLISFCMLALVLVAGTMKIERTLRPKGDLEKGDHPGYFQQWYEEKKSADGTIPSWMHAKWAAWDRSQVKNRANEELIDSVYELGPLDIGGRTRAIWVDPRNDSFILAAAISGGVWRSNNGGNSWFALNDQEASMMPSCFTHSPFNPDIVYYGTGEGRANSADVDGNGIYKSTDGGKTFKVIPSTVGLLGFETIWDIKHSLTDSNTIYVGTNTRGLYRTTDGGQTWEQVLNIGSNQLNCILLLPGDRVLATMQTNAIYYSDSGGKKGTFKSMSISGWPGNGTYRRVQLANCKKFPNVVYAMLEGFGFDDPPIAFFKSSDGGRNWKKQVAPIGAGAGYQAYCVMLGVNPIDSNVVVAGGVSIVQSNNGGASWTTKNVGHSDHHSFAGFTSATNFFLVGNDGGIFKYRYTSGQVFANLNKGYKVTQFYAGNYGPNGFASISGAQDNGTHVATNVLTSKKFFGADGAYAHIGLQDGAVAYFSTQNEGIRRITNFNPSIIPSFTDYIADTRFASDGVNFINAYNMNPADQGQLYYRTNKYIYRSADGGDNWTQITNLHSSIKAIGISNEANPVVYVGGGAAQLYRINDALNATPGSEVSKNTAFPTAITNDFVSSIEVHPGDRNTIFIGFSNYSTQGRVWRISGLDSTNPVFKNISGNLPPGLPVNFVVVDPAMPDQNLFAGTDFGLYYSTDSGKTWIKEMRIPNVAVHEVKMRKDRVLFVYTHGRGLWYITLTPVNGTNQFKTATNAKVYPNPTSSQLFLELDQAPVNATYAVFDATGNLISQAAIRNQSISLDIRNYKSGFYFVRIRNNNQTSTTKILVKN